MVTEDLRAYRTDSAASSPLYGALQTGDVGAILDAAYHDDGTASVTFDLFDAAVAGLARYVDPLGDAPKPAAGLTPTIG